MNRVHNVSSAPEYISKFIQTNMEKLMEIYNDGIQAFGSGCMMFMCSEENNKIDVQFMNDQMMCEILQVESWTNLKNNIPENKKLFFVKDEGLNSVFLIYIDTYRNRYNGHSFLVVCMDWRDIFHISLLVLNRTDGR